MFAETLQNGALLLTPGLDNGAVLILACNLAMALHSPAAPISEDPEKAAEGDADHITAQAATHASIAPKPEVSMQPQTAVTDEPGAITLPIISQPASQPVTLPATHISPEQPKPSTVPHGSNSNQAPEETQAAGTAAKSETSTPSALDVVCADVRGVLVLDFKRMRCFIQHKGVLHNKH